jgi:predicted lipid-binding transport protein (Tim44 family)
MSFKELEEVRAKRVAKDTAKEAKGKGKRGRKRKSAMLEAEEATVDKAKRSRKRKSVALEAEALELIAKVARTSKAPARASVVQMSEILVTEDEIVRGL